MSVHCWQIGLMAIADAPNTEHMTGGDHPFPL